MAPIVIMSNLLYEWYIIRGNIIFIYYGNLIWDRIIQYVYAVDQTKCFHVFKINFQFEQTYSRR